MPEAERAVIGSVLQDPDYCRAHGLEEVTEDWFHDNLPRSIFRVVKKLMVHDETIDVVTVGEKILQTQTGFDVMELARIMDCVPGAANFPAHLEMVRDACERRHLLMACWEAAHLANENGRSSGDMRDRLEVALIDHSKQDTSMRAVDLEEIMPRVLPQIAPIAERAVGGYTSTGIADYDEILGGGFYDGSLNILAGRPSMGKTALAMKMARMVAETKPVLVCSMEMSADELVKNLIALESGVNSYRIRRGTYGDDYAYECVKEASDGLRQLPIFITDAGAMDMSSISSASRRRHYTGGLGLIIIDYLQLIGGGEEYKNRDERVARLSRGCKVLAKALGVPVLLLSQLNREVDSKSRRDHRPRLSDLRESGSIEQDADTVSFLFRKGYYDKAVKDEESKSGFSRTELIVGKQRLGPIGTVLLKFNLRCGDFEPWKEGADEQQGPVGIERGVGREYDEGELPF